MGIGWSYWTTGWYVKCTWIRLLLRLLWSMTQTCVGPQTVLTHMAHDTSSSMFPLQKLCICKCFIVFMNKVCSKYSHRLLLLLLTPKWDIPFIISKYRLIIHTVEFELQWTHINTTNFCIQNSFVYKRNSSLMVRNFINCPWNWILEKLTVYNWSFQCCVRWGS